MKPLITGEIGLDCPKCNIPMQVRRHKYLTDKIIKKPYFFMQWDFCNKCGHVQHYEKYKLHNQSSIASGLL